MSRTITIHKTKGIEHLEFALPKSPGVYLLVGGNGTGKSTIFTALHRICDNMAFSQVFRSSKETMTVDSYKDSCISYQVEKEKVTFSKKEKKWAATPKSGGAVLARFGFKDSVFIKATDSRLSPKAEEIKKGNLEPADEEVKNTLNILFDTERFSTMQRLRNVYGRGKAYTHFYVMNGGKKGYYSEKHFSTGELAMLRLVERLRGVSSESLVLLDEAELALHPMVQIRLLNYLKTISKEKKLTIFVSTHSTTMIRVSSPSSIILLKEDAEKKAHFSAVSPCYPAYAMGAIDLIGHNAPDFIFCVEDDMGQLILQHLIEYYLDNFGKDKLRRLEKRIVPIGGFKETTIFTQNAASLFSSKTRVRAVLDHDVFIKTSTDEENEWKKRQAFCEKHQDRIYDLGVTPELAIITALEKQIPAVMQELCTRFHVQLSELFLDANYKVNCKNPRDTAKRKLEQTVNLLVRSSCSSESVVKEYLVQLLIPHIYKREDIAAIVGSLFTIKH